MEFIDFNYDGINLSDLGYMVCSFNGGFETVSNGSVVTFETIPTFNGSKFHAVSSKYEEPQKFTIQICKIPEEAESVYLSAEEVLELSTWLCRKSFKTLVVESNESLHLYFEGSFNVSKLENYGKVCGLELTFQSNSPFAKMSKQRKVLDFTSQTKNRFINLSTEEGHIYPRMTIKIQQDGDFSLTSGNEGRTMYIRNCRMGEIITVDFPIIKSSIQSHNIQNDFNWTFYRIVRTFRQKVNEVSCNLKCIIELEYMPYVKISI